jgi:formamidopyrimidine-DNA glycosylase
MLKDIKNFRFDVGKLKRLKPLNKDCLTYRKANCPRCKDSIQSLYIPHMRLSHFFCNNCQFLFRR